MAIIHQPEIIVAGSLILSNNDMIIANISRIGDQMLAY